MSHAIVQHASTPSQISILWGHFLTKVNFVGACAPSAPPPFHHLCPHMSSSGSDWTLVIPSCSNNSYLSTISHSTVPSNRIVHVGESYVSIQDGMCGTMGQDGTSDCPVLFCPSCPNVPHGTRWHIMGLSPSTSIVRRSEDEAICV